MFAVSLSSTVVFAAGLGSTPKGKPFVEINGQIVEVKSDISSLQDAHDAIVARVEALEDADFQVQIDFLTAEIARLDAENALRVQDILDLFDLAEQNQFDVGFALSEIQRLQGLINDLSADQIDLIADFQAQIDTLEMDIATNASGLLGAIADAQDNADLIAMLDTDIDNIQADILQIQNDLANKQDLVSDTSCPAGSFVFGVRDNGATLDCAAIEASATPNFLTTFGPTADLDNTSTTVTTHGPDHCHGVVVLGACVGFEHTITQTTITIGDRSVFAFCPSGYRATGGGWNTSSSNVLFVEDSDPSGSTGWRAFIDNRGSANTNGLTARAIVRCVLHQ